MKAGEQEQRWGVQQAAVLLTLERMHPKAWIKFNTISDGRNKTEKWRPNSCMICLRPCCPCYKQHWCRSMRTQSHKLSRLCRHYWLLQRGLKPFGRNTGIQDVVENWWMDTLFDRNTTSFNSQLVLISKLFRMDSLPNILSPMMHLIYTM